MNEKPMARPRRRLRRLALLPVIGGLALAVGMPVTAQAAGHGEDAEATFTCRASALRVDTALTDPIEPFVANDDSAPCVEDDGSLLDGTQLPQGLGEVSAAFARTGMENGSSTAEAGVLDATLNLPAPIGTIEADVLTSEATASCNDGVATFDGSSRIVGLMIGGETIEPIPGETREINVGGEILTVTFARQVVTDDTITQQALVIESSLLGGVEVVIGEAIADVHGCEADKPEPPKPPKPPKGEKPDKQKCNAGRGNGSEIDPATGKDCDPGNSGGKNQGGD